jgi:hypothetical protein
MDELDWLLLLAVTRLVAIAFVAEFWPDLRTGKGPPTDGE